MAHNEDSDLVDDDDQHVHHSNPAVTPQTCLFYFRSAKLVTSSQLNVWEIVSQHHHEVC
jgi:hypothetical protein